MAYKQAYKRLTKEYKQIQENPPPYILCRPLEENILEWHYVITGPPGTPYENGQYHGLVVFPPEYPFRPPAIKMITPSGRFQVNTRICLSMSDFHEDSWNPSWSVSTIVTGLLSFMTGDEHTTGSVVTSERTKRELALKSRAYNLADANFAHVFPDLVQEYKTYQAPEQPNGQVATPVAHNVDDLQDVQDPEDRVRLQQLKTQTEQHTQPSHPGWGAYLLVAVAVVGIAAMMLG